MLGLGEGLEGLVSLLDVSRHRSILCVLALLLNPILLYCLHLLPDFPFHFSVLKSCFSACVILLFQLLSLVAQIQNLV